MYPAVRAAAAANGLPYSSISVTSSTSSFTVVRWSSWLLTR